VKLGIVKVKLDREVNSYVITCASTKEAVVIDPGLPSEKLVDQVKGLTVRYIIATHCHPGHVAGKDELKEVTGGQTAIHSADAKQFLRSADRYLLDGDELEFGEFKLSVHARPHAWQHLPCRRESRLRRRHHPCRRHRQADARDGPAPPDDEHRDQTPPPAFDHRSIPWPWSRDEP